MLGVRPRQVRPRSTSRWRVPRRAQFPREIQTFAIRYHGVIKSRDTRARGLGTTAEFSKENRWAVLDSERFPQGSWDSRQVDALPPHRDVLWDSVLLQRGGSIAGILGPRRPVLLIAGCLQVRVRRQTRMRECHLMMVMVVVVVIVLMTRRRRRIGIHSNGNVHNIDLW